MKKMSVEAEFGMCWVGGPVGVTSFAQSLPLVARCTDRNRKFLPLTDGRQLFPVPVSVLPGAPSLQQMTGQPGVSAMSACLQRETQP